MSSNEKWVGFDLDDVLANMRDDMVRSFSQRCGIDYQVSDWTDYTFFQKHMNLDEFLKMIVDDEIIRKCKPDVGVFDALDELKGEGYSSAVITARGYHPGAHELTQAWFREHKLDIDRLVIVGSNQSKADVLHELPPLCAYVDDHPGHLDAIFKKLGPDVSPKLCLMDRPWNQGREDHHRIYHVNDFKDVVLDAAMQSRVRLKP